MNISILIMIVFTILIVGLFLAGAWIVASALSKSHQAEPAPLPSDGARKSSPLLILGIVLIILSVAVCAFSGWWMLSTL